MKIDTAQAQRALDQSNPHRPSFGTPSTYAQGKTVKNVGAPPRSFDTTREPTQSELDADVIDVMRCELQQSEDRVVELEAQVEERDATIARLTKSIAKLERSAAARG